MTIEFSEYCVTPNWEDSNSYYLTVKDGYIYQNGQKCSNEKHVRKIEKLCEKNFEIAQKLEKEENHPYKGGRQRTLVMKQDLQQVELHVGNNQEVSKFYNKFLKDLQKFIKTPK